MSLSTESILAQCELSHNLWHLLPVLRADLALWGEDFAAAWAEIREQADLLERGSSNGKRVCLRSRKMFASLARAVKEGPGVGENGRKRKLWLAKALQSLVTQMDTASVLKGVNSNYVSVSRGLSLLGVEGHQEVVVDWNLPVVPEDQGPEDQDE